MIPKVLMSSFAAGKFLQLPDKQETRGFGISHKGEVKSDNSDITSELSLFTYSEFVSFLPVICSS